MMRRMAVGLGCAAFGFVAGFVESVIIGVMWQRALHRHGVTTEQLFFYSLFYLRISLYFVAIPIAALLLTCWLAPSLLRRWYVALAVGTALGLFSVFVVQYYVFYPKFPAMASHSLPERIWPTTFASAVMFVAASVFIDRARKPQ